MSYAAPNPLLQLRAQAELERRRRVASARASAWHPDGGVYVNRETGRVYTPHHAEEAAFVFGDGPRRVLCKGGEGCVAAETLINGVPAAEWRGGAVTTLYGAEAASAAFQKGRADLYRVRLQSGREVVVTLEHRFLTPTGWRPLRSLAVGSLLAVHDNENDGAHQGRSKGFANHYLRGFHPYDALPIPVEVDARDKWRQFANSLSLGHYHEFDGSVPIGRFYSADCDFRAERCLSASVAERQRDLVAFAGIHQSFRHDVRHLQATSPAGKDQSPPSNHGVFWFWGDEYRLDSGDTTHQTALFQDAMQFRAPKCLDDENRELAGGLAIGMYPYQIVDASWFMSLIMAGSELNYNTSWDCIDDISFIRHGDFYDLTVPEAEHYEAHGIWHHNSGKSVAGVIKTLERLRRGMNGIMGSPDFEHFKRSLWPEFRRWCPPDALVPAHRRRLSAEWEPARPFTLMFQVPGGGTASLLCGGFDDPTAWEGPNAHFAHFDEARRHKTPGMLKVLDGRVRLVGPHGEPPQLWLTTTPRKHWLYEYFGPWERADLPDPFADFKAGAAVLTLRTADNEAAGNLAAGYTTLRGQSLTASEVRVLLEAGWEDADDVEHFLPSITLWDACREDLPPLSRRTPLVVGVDAGISSDTFAIVAVSRHPARNEHIAVRWVRVYVPKPDRPLDFERIQADLIALLLQHNIVELTYDPLHLHQMMTNIKQRGICAVRPFHQGVDRLIADYSLQQIIIHRRLAHAGDATLRQHLENADAKKDAAGERLRLVKRADSLKIDAAVTLAMAAHRCLKYPL